MKLTLWFSNIYSPDVLSSFFVGASCTSPLKNKKAPATSGGFALTTDYISSLNPRLKAKGDSSSSGKNRYLKSKFKVG